MEEDVQPGSASDSSLRWLPGVTRLVWRIPSLAALVALVALGVIRLPGGDSSSVAALVDGLERPIPRHDVIEVWVCDVPADSTAAVYGGLPLRFDLDPAQLAATFDDGVAGYFSSISHLQYTQSFTPGGTVSMGRDDDYVACVDAAIAGARLDTTVVLAVATAEHAPGSPGGFGQPGRGCTDRSTGECDVAESRRYAYVGASDFGPQWADNPPLDLVEHELGHTLGWVHSGVDPVSGDYLSALDVMSNSAAPRDVDRSRRDAPDTLGVHRLVAGWLRGVEVSAVDDAVTATLSPSNVWLTDVTAAAVGTRLLVLRIDDTSFLTVELFVATGHDSHLPSTGVAVHRVRCRDDDPTVIESIDPITPGGVLPFTDLLQSKGSLTTDGWTIEVVEWSDDGWVVSATPIGSTP
ncbi:MAG: hypothetical protein ACO3C1_00045 [Ilumatobacteraceae bacterium]